MIAKILIIIDIATGCQKNLLTICRSIYKHRVCGIKVKYEAGARGAIYNADAEHLVKLIDFGSSKGQGDK